MGATSQGAGTYPPHAPRHLACMGGEPVRREPLGFHRALIGDEEVAAVSRALRSGWLTTGPRARELEERLAVRVGAPHAVAMSSCTAALHVALLARGIGPGDEVITTPITFAATANVVVHTGARPVFADVDASTLCLDPAAALAAVTERTRAIIPVHFAGGACDLDPLIAAARERQIMVLVDAAHAVETEYRGRPSGADGDAAAYSFYATKNMTTGEGGMLVTADEQLAERSRVLRLHGMSRDAYRRYEPGAFVPYSVEAAGWKYNLTDPQAALGLVQLDRLEAMLERRFRIVQRYDAALAGVPGLELLGRAGHTTRHAHHLYVVQLDLEALGATRDQIAAALVAEGIGIGIHFKALHLEPFYRERFGFAPGLCPVAERAGERVLSLPLYPALTDDEVEDVITAVDKVTRALGAAA